MKKIHNITHSEIVPWLMNSSAMATLYPLLSEGLQPTTSGHNQTNLLYRVKHIKYAIGRRELQVTVLCVQAHEHNLITPDVICYDIFNVSELACSFV